MKSIDSLTAIATTGDPLIPPDRSPRVLLGIMADRFGRPSGESSRRRADGPSPTRWRPGRFGWSEEGRTLTEGQLLECFDTANDLDAFSVLIERHGPMVLAVCRNVLRAQHDVEDAFQDTFLALARRARTIKQSETIGPWLHRVALRLAQKARFEASQRRVRDRNRTDARPEDPVDPPDSSLVRSWG
jgi:hypothetical protein